MGLKMHIHGCRDSIRADTNRGDYWINGVVTGGHLEATLYLEAEQARQIIEVLAPHAGLEVRELQEVQQ